MNSIKIRYGDGRHWNESQRNGTAEVIGYLQTNIAKNDLDQLRRNALWLVDLLFPSGFNYQVGRGPSETVHGGYMEGQA